MQSKIICKILRFERGTFTCPGVTFMCPGDYDDEGGAQICAFLCPRVKFLCPGGSGTILSASSNPKKKGLAFAQRDSEASLAAAPTEDN